MVCSRDSEIPNVETSVNDAALQECSSPIVHSYM